MDISRTGSSAVRPRGARVLSELPLEEDERKTARRKGMGGFVSVSIEIGLQFIIWWSDASSGGHQE